MKSALTKILAAALGLFWLISAGAAEVIPPKPAKYFNDYAGVVSPGTAAQLNSQLEQFERDSYNQIVVAVFPKMQSDSAIEEYTVRVANAWQVGQKDKRNGAVLFVFVQDHKMFLQVGYGLEAVITDATSKDITDDVIQPHFKANDFDGGLAAGVSAILAASKGEYHGTGRTANDRNRPRMGGFLFFIFLFFIVMFVLSRSRNSGAMYSNTGWILGSVISSLGNRGGGGGGGFSGGGGGGGFSSGGGSFGGGGAGGSW